MDPQVSRLKEGLARVLGWDTFVVEGVVHSITQSSREDVEDLVQDFMGGDPAAVKLIDEYYAAVAKPQAPAAPSGSISMLRPSAAVQAPLNYTSAVRGADVVAQQAAAPGDGLRPYNRDAGLQEAASQYGAAASSSAGSAAWHAGDQRNPKAVADAAAAAAAAAAEQQAAALQAASPSSPAADGRAGKGGRMKVLGMFTEGGRIRSGKGKGTAEAATDSGEVKASKKSAAATPKLGAAAGLERPVVNCLGCGKIYDCRAGGSDVARFLERGGLCTFCGARVALSYKDKAAVAAAAAAGPAESAARGADAGLPAPAAAAAAGADQEATADAATAEAIAFKNRLVEYDRNSAQRTTVIDDQADYYDIDANVWLTDAEREQLREQRRIELEAEAKRRKQVVVTLDLIGRKVMQVLDEDSGAAGAGSSGGGCSGGAAAVQPGAAFVVAAGGSSAAGAGGSAATAAAEQQQQQRAQQQRAQEVEAELKQLRQLRISANPAIDAAKKPVFVQAAQRKPRRKQQQQQHQQDYSDMPKGGRTGRGDSARASKTPVDAAAAAANKAAHERGAGAAAAATEPPTAGSQAQGAPPQQAPGDLRGGRRAEARGALRMSEADSFAPRLQHEDVFDDFGTQVLLSAAS